MCNGPMNERLSGPVLGSGDIKKNKIQPYPLRNASLDRETHN